MIPAPAADPGLLIRRMLSVTSAVALRSWATAAGFVDLLPAKRLHVTVAFSRRTFVPEPATVSSISTYGDTRQVIRLGAGAIALGFRNTLIEERWAQLRAAGATWDYEGYLPHVTFTYADDGRDLAKVQPFTGTLIFGPEVHSPLPTH